MIPQCKKSENILDVTDSKYNIRTRVFRKGKIIQVFLYTLNWGEAVSTGTVGHVLAILPEDCRPFDNLTEHVETAVNNKISVVIRANGNIELAYSYNNIPANSIVNQVAKNFTFIAS